MQPPESLSLRQRVADFWLDAMFWQARDAPWVGRLLKPLVMRVAPHLSSVVRAAAHANARRILGRGATRKQRESYARGVLSNFFDFVCDVGRAVRLTPEQLRASIDGADAEAAYFAARASRKGAIIATAHMGSFEAGAAALLGRETRPVHVVFKRDPSRFEAVRSSLRQRLGVNEAPVDEGWTLWLRLREALLRDEVVMVQADRCMPGQKGEKVPFLHGHLLLPTGPVKLALATGAPIVPIFAVRSADGRIRICVEPPITVEPSDASPHPALLQLARVLERYVRDYPEQWLLFHKAFCEDAP